MTYFLLSIALAAPSECPEHPPRLVLPWTHRERTSTGEGVALGRRRGGQPDGTWCHWSPSGRLIEVVTWNRGVRDGPYHRWGADQAEVRGAYRAGERHGPWTEIHPSGRLKLEGAYVDGERHGLWRSANRERIYDHGVLDGVQKRFSADGELIAEQTFVAGVIDGPVHTIEGGVETRGVIRAGVREGEWVVSDADGERERGHYVGGKRTGVWVEFTGQDVETTTWASGKKHGPYRYERSGLTISEGSYRDDQLIGLWVTVDGGGTRREITYRDGTLHGPYRVVSAAGEVTEEGLFDKGQRSGLWTLKTAEGERRGAYEHGAKEGIWVLRVDGVKTAEDSWSADRRDGPERRWTGEVKRKDCGWKAGRQHGECRTWAADGTPQQLWTWRDGVSEGPFSSWHDNGTRSQQGANRAGKNHGPYRAWSPDGTLITKGRYADGVQVGAWVWWQDNGAVERKGSYDEQGRKQGVWIERFYSGALLSRGSFVDGKRSGPWVYGYASGQRRLEGEYQDDRRSGDWKGWHANGALAKQGRYAAGMRNGRWTYYRLDGGVARVVDFADGAVLAVDPTATWIGGEPDPMPDPEDTPPPSNRGKKSTISPRNRGLKAG